MDEEYYKTLCYYVESLSIQEKIEKKQLDILIKKCPEEFISSYKTREYRLTASKNISSLFLDNVSQTNLVFGVCYFLAKTEYMFAEFLVPPLLTYINVKICPRVFYDPRMSTAHQEKCLLERTNWWTFSIIASTLISYTLKLPANHSDIDIIMKSLMCYWLRIIKSIFKLFTRQGVLQVKSKTAEDKTSLTTTKKPFLSWYIMAFSSVSIGLFLRLEAQHLAQFILKPDSYFDFLQHTKYENIEIPEIIIKEISNLMNLNVYDAIKDKYFNLKPNLFSPSKKVELKVMVISAIAYLMHQTGHFNVQSVNKSYTNPQKIFNCQRLTEIIEERLKNEQISISNIRFLNLDDVVNYENKHLDESTLIYSKCLINLTTLLTMMYGNESVLGLENLCDKYFKKLFQPISFKFPMPRDEIFIRIAYLHGLHYIVDKYPQHINRLCIFEKMVEIVERKCSIFLILGENTYSNVLELLGNSLAAFTHEYFNCEKMSNPIPNVSAFHFYYNQKMLILFLDCLKIVLEHKMDTNPGAIMQIINSASQSIYEAKNIEKPIPQKDANLITHPIISVQILSYIAARFMQISGVYDSSLSVLQKCFIMPWNTLDLQIVDHMVYLFLKNPTKSNYSTIMDPLKKTLMSNFSTKNKTDKDIDKQLNSICTTISHNFPSMAIFIENNDLRLRFMQDMLGLFIDLSAISRKSLMGQERLDILINVIYCIIQALSLIMQKIGRVGEFTPQVQELFKKFWVSSIVTSGSDNTSLYGQNILEHFKEIATFSPPLVVDHLRSYLAFNLPKDAALSDSDLFETKNLLIKALECSSRGDITSAIFKLTSLHVVYLVAFYEQESLAVEKDTKYFPNIFLYLEDPTFEKENITFIIEFICEKIFLKFIDQLLIRLPGSNLDQDLVNHISFLLLNFNSERKKVRRAADRYLSILMNKFTHMLWNSSVIKVMLDFMNALRLTSEKLDYGNNISLVIDMPHTNYRYSMPDTKEKRNEIILDYQSRCQSLINEATRCAPSVVSSILLDYVVENRLSAKDINIHYGMDLLINSMIQPEQPRNIDVTDTQISDISTTIMSDTSSPKRTSKERGLDTKQQPVLSDFKSIVSSYIFTAANRIQYIGQIHGLLIGKTHEIIAGKKVYPEFESYLQSRMNMKEKIPQQELESFVMRCTAYICSTKHFLRKIIFFICSLPVNNFSISSIDFAIESWEWIFTSCKKHQISLLSMICSAWDNSAKMKLGMFNFVFSNQYSKTYYISQANVHNIWLKFLIEKYDQVKYYSTAQVSIMSRFVGSNLQALLTDKNSLNEEYFEINCLPYIKLIIFGFKLLEKQYLNNLVCRIEYRERLIRAILIYFSINPLWPDTQTTKNLIDSIYLLYTLLINDRKWQNFEKDLFVSEDKYKNQDLDSYIFTLSATMNIPKRITSSSGTLVLRKSKTSLTNSPEPRMTLDAESALSLPKSLQTLLSDSFPASRCFKSLNNEDISHIRSTILLICGRELERLTTWLDPLDKSSNIAKQIKNIKAAFTDKKYQERLSVLWFVSPSAFVNLTKRFPDVPFLYKDICSAVKQHPERVMDKASAISFFWSQDMIKVPQHIRSMMLIWDRCEITQALEFFSINLHNINIITTQYAISCFKTSQIDQLLSYIPQLVQCLRQDPWSYVKNFILWISQKNNIISHQFIWNMQTNAYTDEESTILDAQIGPILLELVQEIKDNFSETALKFYSREFSFFHDITKISGILKPLEKPQRKKKCQEELQKIVTEFGVYLPTNPDSIILNIDYTSGIPMQSAAKAPFLARFNILMVNTETVEKFNITSDALLTNLISSEEAVRLKGAIFKVGDDVRQDVLALQLISFFKNIFSKIGLSLFLYPYKVVATSPGCGVIECVEKAKSRDQLGKQTDVNLHQYFIQKYGKETTMAYKRARENFTNSLAAYSVVSFLLQVKDRHNGNIMIDEDGHIIHIGIFIFNSLYFGFLFESSPGGNIGFEPNMKITQEMLDILGGSLESPYYKTFVSQTIKGYLALRPYHKEIINTVSLMLGSNLPCFRGETIARLKFRLGSSFSEREAVDSFEQAIKDSVLNVRTRIYDLIQKAQNEIPC